MDKERDAIPDADEGKTIWSAIWNREVSHNENAKWLKDVEKEEVDKQREIVIMEKVMAKQIRNLPNWKAPTWYRWASRDWLKYMTSVRKDLALHVQNSLENHNPPRWLVTGSPTLIMKDKMKGAEVSNFRLITCFPLMWKLLTGILSEEMYQHLE